MGHQAHYNKLQYKMTSYWNYMYLPPKYKLHNGQIFIKTKTNTSKSFFFLVAMD